MPRQHAKAAGQSTSQKALAPGCLPALPSNVTPLGCAGQCSAASSLARCAPARCAGARRRAASGSNLSSGVGRLVTSASAPSLPRQHPSSSSSSSKSPGPHLASSASAGELRSIGGLTEDDLAQLRQLQRPPAVVRRALQAVHFVVSSSLEEGQPPAKKVPWPDVQRMLCPERLSQVHEQRLRELQGRPEVRERLNRDFLAPSGEDPLSLERVHRASPPAAALLRWSTQPGPKSAQEVGERTPTESVTCIFKCSCGYASGSEEIFQNHMRSVQGSPDHEMVKCLRY